MTVSSNLPHRRSLRLMTDDQDKCGFFHGLMWCLAAEVVAIGGVMAVWWFVR